MRNTLLQASFLFLITTVFLPSAAKEPSAVRSPFTGVAAGYPVRLDPVAEAKVRDSLKRLNPNLDPEYIGPASAPGYQEVIIKGQVVFVTNDGNYLVQGLMDLSDKQDVAQSGALPGMRLSALNDIPASERIVFAPDGPIKHTVSVFTDVECGFCRKMHQEISEYNKIGIAVEYFAFPRAGLDSPDAAIMESIWCSQDRRKALTLAKQGMTIPPLKCDNPVARHHDVGKRIGLQGTPMIINADGIALPGYLPPGKLLQALDALPSKRMVNAPGRPDPKS